MTGIIKKQIDARSKEREFIRLIEKHAGLFHTANGSANVICEITDTHYIFATSKSKQIIPRRAFRLAIYYLFSVRTVIRDDLFKFNKFTSAMLGMLRIVFNAESKYVKTPKGLYRLTLKGLRFFFAGCTKAVGDMKLAVKNGARYFLLAYIHIRSPGNKKWKEHLEELDVLAVLDSSAYTEWQDRLKGKSMGEPLKREKYADFIIENERFFMGYFNLDVVGDPVASAENYRYLKSRGLSPWPVYHVQSDFSVLENMIREDHALIGIGGTVGMSEIKRRKYFIKIFERFPEQNFHFLGGCSQLLNSFPWFSADATTWIDARQYGKVIDADGKQRYAPELPVDERMRKNVRYLTELEEM